VIGIVSLKMFPGSFPDRRRGTSDKLFLATLATLAPTDFLFEGHVDFVSRLSCQIPLL
jgi:hypothetical protein